ncbi:MAG: 2-dehydropantoate 2-reductase [Actinomycetota bacterium]|nr:2-dehydropantoate 2-reductase [Actinomycetota bacterium]
MTGSIRVAVYGAGAVGGFFGGRLAQTGADVSLIARGSHLEILRKEGLRVRSVRGDFTIQPPATDDPNDVGPCDYVLFCVKSFDTEEASARLGPLLKPGTAVVSLQNGVDNEEKIAASVGWDHVMGGVTYIFASIAEPGVITDAGGPAKVIFGEFGSSTSSRAKRLLDLFQRAGVNAELSDNIRGAIWYKFTFIVALAGMTAAVRLPIGDIRTTRESWEMFRRILEEVCAVAAAEGVILPQDTVDQHMRFAEGLEAESYSSLYHDMTHGNRMELEALHGTAVRLGHRHGVAVPMCEAIYATLRPWAARAMARHA